MQVIFARATCEGNLTSIPRDNLPFQGQTYGHHNKESEEGRFDRVQVGLDNADLAPAKQVVSLAFTEKDAVIARQPASTLNP